MKTFVTIIRSVAILGLILILLISILYARGSVSLENYKIVLLVSSVIWFSGILIANLIRKRQT